MQRAPNRYRPLCRKLLSIRQQTQHVLHQPLLVRVNVVMDGGWNWLQLNRHCAFFLCGHHAPHGPRHRVGEVDALDRRVQLDAGRCLGEVDASVNGHVHEVTDESELLYRI